MKKIFGFLFVLIALNSKAQYIVNQTLGSDSTLVTSKGAFKSKIVNYVFTDTTQANTHRIKQYPGGQIFTSTDNSFWIRNSDATHWLKLAVSAGVGTVTSIGTTAPITGGTITTSGTIGITQSSTSIDGYLSSTDWNTFNNKASTASVGAKLDTSGSYVNSGTIIWPGTIYSTPTVGVKTDHAISYSPTLASQSAYTLFGRGSGSGTPSFLSSIDSNWIPALHTEAYYNTKYAAIGGGGGSQTLQQTTDLGNTTTKVIYSTDSIKAYSNYSSGGAMFGDSSTIQTDSTWFYGASIELGSSGLTAGGIAWTTQVATYITTTSVNKAIASTRFSKISTGDSSFMDRLSGTPTYLSTRRYIVIGGSNILNDYTTNSTGVPNLQSNLAKAIDTLHINRGWPLSKIIIAIPSLIGTSAGGTRNNDSLGYYARGAIATAISKGVPYVDNYTFTINNGGVSLINSDSIHPNNTGHNIMAKGFRFRISDVGFANSASIERNLYVRSNAQVDGKLILPSFVTGGQTMSGSINWGANGNLNGNGIVLYDAGSTSLRSGLGFSTSDGSMSIFARGSAPFKIAPGQDATTATTANSTIYIQQSVPTPVTLGEHTAVNGSLYSFNFLPTTITYPTTTNSINAIDYGPGGIGTPGIYAYNNHTTTALRAGLIYDRLSTQQTFIFGRGSYKMLFGQGHDQTDMTTSNASFWIDSVTNVVNFNGFATAYVAKTTTYTIGATDHTINCTSGTFTVTLPTAVNKTGRVYTIVNSGSGTITIGTTSSQTFVNINTAPTTLTLGAVGAAAITSYTVQSNGANWMVIAKVKDE